MGNVLFRLRRQIGKCSLQLLKGLGFISASPLNINKRQQRHTRTYATMLGNKKYGTQKFAVIFKTLPFDRNKTQKNVEY